MSAAPMVHPIPTYAAELSAEREAKAWLLARMLAHLPVKPGQRVLDVGAGDGWYSCQLSRRLGGSGLTVAVDIRPQYLSEGRQNGDAVQRVVATAGALPFADASFDISFCAHSMVSLDPRSTLREMRRVTRAGGYVVVLENDSLHALLLPWPADLELLVRIAELKAFRQLQQAPGAYNRRLCEYFADAGLPRARRKTFVADCTAPFTPAQSCYLQRYFTQLKHKILPHLPPRYRQPVARACTPGHKNFLLGTSLAGFTLIESLYWARVEASARFLNVSTHRRIVRSSRRQ